MGKKKNKYKFIFHKLLYKKFFILSQFQLIWNTLESIWN